MSTETLPNLTAVLDLAHARALVVRDVDRALGAFHGIGLSDLALLLALRDAPGRRLRRLDLAERLGITPSGVARQVAPLERIGVVAREPSPGDARLALVVLTEAGARVVDEALPSAEEAAERALGRTFPGEAGRRLADALAGARPRG